MHLLLAVVLLSHGHHGHGHHKHHHTLQVPAPECAIRTATGVIFKACP